MGDFRSFFSLLDGRAIKYVTALPKSLDKSYVSSVDDIKKIQDLIRARRKDIQELKRKRQFFQRGPEKVEKVLHTLFKDNSEMSQKIEESRALAAWPTIVGEAAANSSLPLKIRNNVLVIEVSDSLWTQQLILLKNGILKKYREAFPQLKIEDIFFTRK